MFLVAYSQGLSFYVLFPDRIRACISCAKIASCTIVWITRVARIAFKEALVDKQVKKIKKHIQRYVMFGLQCECREKLLLYGIDSKV